jgi:uracil-DNA glycosylase
LTPRNVNDCRQSITDIGRNKNCLSYLLTQIEIVEPKAIIALGPTAVRRILGDDPMRRMWDM